MAKQTFLLEAKRKPVPQEWYSKITAEIVNDNWPTAYISGYFAEVLNGTTSLDEMRDNILSFDPEYQEWQYGRQVNENGNQDGNTMKNYRPNSPKHFLMRFRVKSNPTPYLYRWDTWDASCIDEAMQMLKNSYPDISYLATVSVEGRRLKDNSVEELAEKWFSDTLDKGYDMQECDAGGAVGGGAGGAGDAGGAAPAPSASGDAGDVAGEMAGTTSAEVLGTNEPGKGFFGPGNFYIPARAKHPLHRWECAYGGSKRKKGKNGKPMKTPYEKGMKVVVSMFEDEHAQKYTKTQIQDAIAYWQKQLDAGNYK